MKKKRTFLVFMSVLVAIVVLSWGVGLGWAQPPESNPGSNQELKYRSGKITSAERKDAAKRNRALGLKPGVAGKSAMHPLAFSRGERRKITVINKGSFSYAGGSGKKRINQTGTWSQPFLHLPWRRIDRN